MGRLALNINFGGGLNTRDAEFSIGDNESPDMANVVYNEISSIETRAGSTLVGDDTGNQPIMRMGVYRYSNGTGTITNKLFRVTNTDLELWNGSTTWTAQGRTLTANTPGNFVQANNELYYFNGTEAVQNLSNTTWSTLASGTPMSGANNIGRYAAYIGGKLYVAGTNANPSRLYVSGDTNSSIYTPEDFSGGWAYDIGQNDGSGIITGLAELNGTLVVYKQYGVYVVRGEIAEGQSVDRKVVGIGACAQHTIATDESIQIFQAMDGHVYAFDGNKEYKLSDKIDRTIDALVTTSLNKSNAEIFDDNGRKYILNVVASGTTPNKTLVLDLERSVLTDGDYKTKVWLPWTGINSLCMVKYAASGKEELYYGEATANSLTYKMFTGTSDNGVAINAYYVTKNFDCGEPERDKKYKYLYVSTKAVGDWSLPVQYAVDGGDFANSTPSSISLLSQGAILPFHLDDPDEATMGEGFLATSNTVVIPAASRFIKIKFSLSTLDKYFHIYKATLYFRYGKLRKRIAAL